MQLPVNEFQSLDFLYSLSAEKKELALKEAELCTYKRNQVIFAQNDPVEYFGIVLDGLVSISKNGFSSDLAEADTTKKQIIDIIPSHEFFGGLLILNRLSHYPVTVSCLSAKAKVILISKDFFQKTWLTDSDLMSLFQKNVFNRVQSMQTLKEIYSFTTEEKIKNAFRFLYKKELTQMDKDYVEFALTRKQLAEICNTTTETAIRILSQWHKLNLMFTDNDKEYIRSDFLKS